MAEETTPNAKPTAKKKEKPPALEDKPFTEFMEQHFTPTLHKKLMETGLNDVKLSFSKRKLAIPGVSTNEPYWQVIGTWNKGQRQFNLYFLEEDISGSKAFSYGTDGLPPSTIESFMIDERKVTLDLMVLYTLQRLNGQKWLTRN
ncbi:hypothetical protein RGRSB_1034 [cyanobacterium endosymbiont of Rhopalodia gibberula]|uniref:DUF2996 domain-containing protein n=1 Tax=cyanobacterium endosymbiont of Rhopalodia gibberula TaxID=1763363 RepID=UPI000DC70342|nr:DUF2996 domain-containing protein [cyanobacterium endosymbiont of Rhopalodia gibberula]BBA79531.1 hypothetical protein RGRSB_1034 [cyanobacterium endosymbiont of Rhopalodia gibberula]